jgi:hypothetical protein
MASTGEVQPAQPSPSVLEVLRQPRVMLILLAIWDILGVITQLLSASFLFDMKGAEASGIFGGRAFSASALIPAIVYLWALRDPQQHRRVFWLGLIEQVALILSSFYHRGAGDITWAGAVIPSLISGALIFLIFPNLFQPRAAAVPQPVGSLPSSSGR